MKNIITIATFIGVTIFSIWLYYSNIGDSNKKDISKIENNKKVIDNKSNNIARDKSRNSNFIKLNDSKENRIEKELSKMNKDIELTSSNIKTQKEIDEEIEENSIEDEDYNSTIDEANIAFNKIDSNFSDTSNNLENYEEELISLNDNMDNSFSDDRDINIINQKKQLQEQREIDLNRLKEEDVDNKGDDI